MMSWLRSVVCGMHGGVLLAAATLLVGCHTGENYPSPGPRYAGTAADTFGSIAADSLRVVTFNIAFARQVDSAIALLSSHPELRGADIVLLQEMDAAGTERIARALGLHWVYYPAMRSLRTERDFGNAVLSRWPIVADERLILPHEARTSGIQRTATAATVRTGTDSVRVYSTHLGTVVELSAAGRRDQLRAVLDDADRFARVVIGGDMNDEDVGELARERGYDWPTREGPRTTAIARWDHVFTRGLAPGATGTVEHAGGASDHRPVWLRLRLRPVADVQAPE